MSAPETMDVPRRALAAEDRIASVWAAYGCLGACLLAYLALELVRRAGSQSIWINGWGVDAGELIACLLCFARAGMRRRGRAITLLLGLGLLLWTSGDTVLTIQSLGGATPPSPSLADAFYFAFYPVTYGALTLLLRREVRLAGASTWLDGAIAGLGAAAVCAAFAFHGVAHAAGGSALSVATDLAYPIGDLLLLVMVAGITAILPGRRSAAWLLLAAGLAAIVTGDTFNLFSSSIGGGRVGTLFNALAWPTYILLVSASVWLPEPAPAPAVASERIAEQRTPGFLLPAFAAAAAVAIPFVATVHPVGAVALALAAAALTAAGLRSGLTLLALRRLTEERQRQSVTDHLTGLRNRRALSRLLHELLPDTPEADAPPRRLSFLFIDLSHFKEVNDSFGHFAGDELLRQLGARLEGSLRSTDLLVRLGGDEFAVVLQDADADYGAMVAQRLAARLEEPFLVDGIRVRVGASIGIAVAPQDARTPADLVRCADHAMYRAKLAGQSFAIFNEDLDGDGDKLRLAEELRLAVEQRQFELHYQPQVDLQTGEIVAVEALLRWPHPRLGFVPPPAFLPLAEESDLMGPLTELVLDEATRQCAAWRAAGHQLTVSVNVSPTNLVDPEFTATVKRTLERNRLAPEALVLEVTETSAISNLERSKAVIEEMQASGVMVSVDDFGAGFTSLAYLGSLAVGELKLDRSFVTELATAAAGRDVAIVQSTLELAHSLGLRVVAEGVEDLASLELLRDLGCDLAQGYLISRPKPAAELDLTSPSPCFVPRRPRAPDRPRAAQAA
jgi:diguanylate cyclase (GGDEF)-like protein